jgi:hypothetical protein
MSKHSKKHREKRQSNSSNGFDLNNFDLSQMGNLFNNINPNQLSNMLNNIDMNQLSGMLQGFNNQGNENSTNVSGQQQSGVGDKRIELLNAIKPLVDADKTRIIDSIIQMYTISKIVKK